MGEDKLSSLSYETPQYLIRIRTQILDEGNLVVLMVTKKVTDKRTGRTETVTLVREELEG